MSCVNLIRRLISLSLFYSELMYVAGYSPFFPQMHLTPLSAFSVPEGFAVSYQLHCQDALAIWLLIGVSCRSEGGKKEAARSFCLLSLFPFLIFGSSLATSLLWL